MKKDKLLTIKISEEERAELKKFAESEGHNSVSGFIMWLIRQRKNERLKKR